MFFLATDSVPQESKCLQFCLLYKLDWISLSFLLFINQERKWYYWPPSSCNLTLSWLSLTYWTFLGFPGWAFADSVLHRLAPLWIGARGLEFTWEYIFQGLEANANLVWYPKTVKNIMSDPLFWLFIQIPDNLLLFSTGDDPFPCCIRILDVAEEEQTKDSN